MTAATLPRKPKLSALNPRQYPVKAGVKVLEGAVLGLLQLTGTVDNIAADPTLIPWGSARSTVDNTGSLTPAPEVYVDETCILLFSSGLTRADEGRPVYGVDNQTFSTTDTVGALPIGRIHQYVSATSAYVELIRPDPTAIALAQGPAGDGPGAALTDAAATINITGGDWRVLPAATLTAARVLTIGTTGAKANDKLTVTRQDATANTYTLNNGGAGAGTLVVLPASKQAYADLYFDGTNWSLVRTGAI